MTKNINEKTVVGGVMAVFGLTAFLASLAIDRDSDGDMGARIFPMMGAIAIFSTGIFEILKGVRSASEIMNMGRSARDVFSMMLVGVAYIFLIGKLGYLMATGLAAAAAFWLFGLRNPFRLVVAAISCPIIYHVLFFKILGVWPPSGEWFDLLSFIKGL